MKKLTLDEMIEAGGGLAGSSSAWVKQKGFNGIYVRVGRMYINGELHENVINLANFEATTTGKGTFKKLIVHLRERWPQHDIYIESVITPRFEDGLKRMGFLETEILHCFWMSK